MASPSEAGLAPAIPSASPQPGRTFFVVGPPGSGKSSLIREALVQLGGGVVLMAPGLDEANSYHELMGQAQWAQWQEDGTLIIPPVSAEKPYLFAGVDDDFFPSLGTEKGSAKGLNRAVQFIRAVKTLTHQAVARGEPLPYPVLGTDTFTGFGQMAFSSMLSSMALTLPPKAKGEGGADFYTGYRLKMEEIARVCRALRGYGVHWIATGHVTTKETKVDHTRAEEEGVAKDQIVPIFTGVFRDTVNAVFDLVLYSGVKGGKYMLKWKPDSKRPAKSRVGQLQAEGKMVPNSWASLMQAYDEAKR